MCLSSDDDFIFSRAAGRAALQAIRWQISSIRQDSRLHGSQHFDFAEGAFAARKFSVAAGTFSQRVTVNVDGVNMLENFDGSIERVGHVAVRAIVSCVARASARSSCYRFVVGERFPVVPRVAPAKS